MDAADAKLVLDECIARYRPLSFTELVSRIGQVDAFEVVRPNARPWQIEVLFVWDDQPSGDVRVIASIDDGGVRAFAPLSDSFIKTSAGRFVDK